MEFKRYDSIENHYREKFLWLVRQNFPNMKYVITEKVHGANFSILYDGKKVKYASRNNILHKDSNFNNYKTLIHGSLEAVLVDYLKGKGEDASIQIFGEIFGGAYPHLDVPFDPKANKVQKGVYYSPSNKFLAFDIKLNGSYVERKVFENLCNLFSIPFLPSLFEGTLEECLEYNNMFQSTIPKLYNLPEIADNTCEGIVISPIFPCFLDNGNRVIIKSKNDKFSEKKQVKKVINEVKLSEIGEKLCLEFRQLINTNRYNSVVSKLEDVTIKDFGKIIKLFREDAWDEFEGKQQFNFLDKKEQNMINKLVNSEISKIIKGNI